MVMPEDNSTLNFFLIFCISHHQLGRPAAPQNFIALLDL